MKHQAYRQHGMALIAVLWLVASMSLIISGVVRSVRLEAQSVSAQRQMTLAGAKADAAILLALQRLLTQKDGPTARTQKIQVPFEDATYDVWVIPLNSYLDINNASPGLLSDFYQFAARMDQNAARSLAQATVDARQVKNHKGLQQGFDAPSDLMNVPGMTYGVYAKVAHLVSADIKGGSGRINPFGAPPELLAVLAGGNVARATQFATQRDANPITLDSTFFKPEYTEMAASTSTSLRVKVMLPDGSAIQKTWRIYWSADTRSGLPWHILDIQQTNLASSL
jgi:general secretion pathway protein K